MKLLSEMPTDKAMKELSQMRFCPPAIKQVIETMAISKMDLVKSIKLLDVRALWLERAIQVNITADKAVNEYLADNPDYEISFK